MFRNLAIDRFDLVESGFQPNIVGFACPIKAQFWKFFFIFQITNKIFIPESQNLIFASKKCWKKINRIGQLFVEWIFFSCLSLRGNAILLTYGRNWASRKVSEKKKDVLERRRNSRTRVYRLGLTRWRTDELLGINTREKSVKHSSPLSASLVTYFWYVRALEFRKKRCK